MVQKATPKKTAKKAAPPKKSAPKAAKRPEPVKSKPAAAPVAVRKSKPEPKVDSKPAAKSSPVHTPPARSLPAQPIAKEKKEKVVPLTKSDLQYFRNLLLERRREIIGDVGSMESEAFKGGSNLSNMPIHMADVGTDNFEQEFTLGLIESERQTLREIQEALIRIDDGKYGICQGTGKQIPRVRLEAMPWAKYTKEYSQALEQGKISRDDADASDDESGEEDEE
jgi:RNA polymerase-binding transcription factor DksA